MTLEDELNTPYNISSHYAHHHHLLMDWLEDSISILPTFLNEPYSVLEEFLPCEWFVQDQNPSFAPSPAAAAPPLPIAAKPEPLPITPKPSPPKKRKLSARELTPSKKSSQARTNNNSSNGMLNSANNGAGKEVRWAEQLLNPLAAAIDAANHSRAQHLVYVLQELASPAGDANHRLAFHGLQSLARQPPSPAPTFASTDPRTFRAALIKFHEVSAWLAFPNCLANAAILHAAQLRGGGATLHLVDAGASHGLQWPTLMEALARRGAPHGTVRLTVVEAGSGGPFGRAPAGYDFVPQLVRYAKSVDLNLRVERGEVSRGIGKELVVLCVQFRAGRVGAGFWRAVREAEVDMVVVTEMEEGRGEGGFGRRAEMMWRFLESTGVAFKGKDGEERRVVEGEAARMLEGDVGEGEGGRWRERMEGEGYREEGFGEEAMEAGRGLLKKYDGGWEMRDCGGEGAAVGLCWKGQVVSVCSLWRPAWKGIGGGGGGGMRYIR